MRPRPGFNFAILASFLLQSDAPKLCGVPFWADLLNYLICRLSLRWTGGHVYRAREVAPWQVGKHQAVDGSGDIGVYEIYIHLAVQYGRHSPFGSLKTAVKRFSKILVPFAVLPMAV